MFFVEQERFFYEKNEEKIQWRKKVIPALVGAFLGILSFLSGDSSPVQATFPHQPPESPNVAASSNVDYKVFLPLVTNGNYEPTNSKRGVGVPYPPDCENIKQVKAAWAYSWNSDVPRCDDVDYVPMVWSSFANAASASRYLLGGNECDLAEQCNINPQNYVGVWKKIEDTYPNYELVSPAPSSGNNTWLPDFRNAYLTKYGKPPRLNYLAAHCYAYKANSCEDLVTKRVGLAKEWGAKGVWLTEWMFYPCYNNDALSEMKQFLPWLDSNSDVFRYSYFALRYRGDESWAFTNCNAQLVDFTTKQLTPFGLVYKQ